MHVLTFDDVTIDCGSVKQVPINCSPFQAKDGLQEAKDCLMKTIGDDAKKLGVHLDSYILLGKLNYAMGNYSESLRYGSCLEMTQIDDP